MDTDYLHSFRRRMQSRLEQVKSITEQLAEDKKAALELLMQFGGYIGTPEEVNQLREQIDSLGTPSGQVVDGLIDELEIIEKLNWQSESPLIS